MLLALALVAALGALDAVAGTNVTLRGRVIDAKSGEAVPGAHVTVSAGKRETTADAEGRFAFSGLERGGLTLRVSAPAFRPFVSRLALGTAPEEFVVPLEREPPRLSENLTVTSPTAPTAELPSPLVHRYDGELIRVAGSVAASDPLRAVQALPGVAANDELNAGFATRGSGFSAAGLYIDGVRLSAPFHTIRDINDGYTLTIFNADIVDTVSLAPGAAPARHADRIGAALAVRTREGRRDGFHGRASLGAAGAYATLEAPLGGRASWLVSARKSYLDYVLKRVDDDPRLALGYYDLTSRVTLHPRPSQTLSLLGLYGRSRYENTEPRPDPHEMLTAAAGTGLLHLSWRGTPSAALSLGATGFLLRETGDNRDTDGFQRFSSELLQGGVQGEATVRLGAHRLEGGLEARRLQEDVLSRRFGSVEQAPRAVEDYILRGWLLGAFLQDTWAVPGGRVALTLGGRIDHLDSTGETVLLPRAALDLPLGSKTRVAVAGGSYAQFPSFERLAGEHGNPGLDAERSWHLVLSLEHRLLDSLRLRLDAYAQRESRLVFNRELEYRLEGGRVVPPRPGARLQNSLSGPSRGVELSLGAAPSLAVSGWIAYAYAHARRRDADGLWFDSDFDQRHTLTLFARARVGKTGFLTTAFRHGSAFPVPGFLRGTADGVFVAAERNLFRPPAYRRWDVRGEKRFVRGRFQLGLYVEVVNLLDRENIRYTEIDSVDPTTGRARLDSDDLLPLLPLFGVSADF